MLLAACAAAVGARASGQTHVPTYRARVQVEPGASAHAVSSPRAISAGGLAVGVTWEHGKPSRGWSWDGTTTRYLSPPRELAGAWTYALGVNSDGVIAGAIEHGGTSYGALWSGDDVTVLAPINVGDAAGANAINDFGLATGGSWPGGIVWRNGVAETMPLVEGAVAGSAFLVNNAGTFAGYGVRPGQRPYPARWTDGGGEWLELPDEPRGAQEFVGTQLTGMNQRGDVVGWTTRYGFTGSGQLWTAEGDLVDLGGFDPENPGLVIPWGINDSGWIVGRRNVAGGAPGAFLWTDGAMLELGTLLDASGAGLELVSANGINNEGVILATALIDGRQVPVLLTPVPSPGGGGWLVALGVLLSRRRRR